MVWLQALLWAGLLALALNLILVLIQLYEIRRKLRQWQAGTKQDG